MRYEWGRKNEASLGVRILLQVLRFALVALFFYIAYLGFQWRLNPRPSAPRAPEKEAAAPAAPASRPAVRAPSAAPAPEGPSPEKAR